MASMKKYEVHEPYISIDCSLGESPYWEESTNTLRFVDILKNKLYAVNLDDGPSSLRTVASLETPVCVTADVEGDDKSLVFFGKHSVSLMNKSDGSHKVIKELWGEEEKTQGKAHYQRSNDGAVDSRGRYWAGTMNDPPVKQPGPEGTFFRLDQDLTLHRIFSNVTIPNGLSWSLDDRTMYWTETAEQTIYAFDYDADSGSITNKRVFDRFTEGEEGGQDGHAMDVEGHLWVACYGQSRVVRISPQGERVAVISLPTRAITCTRFAGEWLYITSGAETEPEKYPESAKYAGNVFRCHVGIQGRPSNKFKLDR